MEASDEDVFEVSKIIAVQSSVMGVCSTVLAGLHWMSRIQSRSREPKPRCGLTEGEAFETLLEDEESVKNGFDEYESLYGTPGFKQILSMPGVVLSTNATSRQGTNLTWEFQLDSLALQDYLSKRVRA